MNAFVGQSAERKELLNRTFAGLPIEDATAEMYVCVTPADIEAGNPRDPQHCVFAEACRRTLNAEAVVFLRTFAYVDVPTGPGTRKVLRFQIPSPARKFIANYDADGSATVGTFTLKPPPSTDRLGERRRESKGPGGHAKKVGRNADALTVRGVRLGNPSVYHSA